METATLNISMPQTLKDQIDDVMQAEGYGNTSEFIRDLVRNHLKQFNERRLEEMLLKGLQSPVSEWTKQDVADVKAAVKKRLMTSSPSE